MRGLQAEYQRLRAMPQRWVLPCVAEIPKVVTNSILIQAARFQFSYMPV